MENNCGKNNMELLKERQKYPLKAKIELTKLKIKEWYEHFDGKVYVSFSGGKDSTVLLHIARSIYPDIEAVFIDTGLEFPEIRQFVKDTDNVTWIKPKKTFRQVLDRYGYPIISKEQSCYIDQYRNTKSAKLRDIRFNGMPNYRIKSVGKISEKWKYLIDAPFKISDRCCYALKKYPAKKFERDSGKKPIVGTMATDSAIRSRNYAKEGCNSFSAKRQISKPLSFWNEQDIWDYIGEYCVLYSDIYRMGYKGTGCVFCLYGHHLSKIDRMELMKRTHPKLYKYCMEQLNFKDILEWYPKRINSL